MPALWQPDGSQDDISLPPSRTLHLQARAQASEEASALPNGQRALTPIIAGTISGTCVAVAWLVALIHILIKRYRRKRRYKKVGQGVDAYLKSRKEDEERRQAEFILPPDPAVLEGGHTPGERVSLQDDKRWWKKEKRRQRRRASSASGSEPERTGKGKARERPISPKRVRTTSGLAGRRHSFGSHQHPTLSDEEERVELRPHPYPYYQRRLSTIISASDSQGFLTRHTPPPAVPIKDFKQIDFVAPVPVPDRDRDDKSLVEHDIAREHKYPPSHSQ